jgi:hypothetical protein
MELIVILEQELFMLEVLDGWLLRLLLLSLDLEVGLLPSSRVLCSVTTDTLRWVVVFFR